MASFKRILVSVDSVLDHQPALQCAESFAEHHQATLVLMDVQPEIDWPMQVMLRDYGYVKEQELRDKRERIDVGGPSVNPTLRIVPKKMIETKVPMIDVFNCLVESQKIPIFSIAGEPYNKLLARVGIQADADIIVFCGLGLIFDEFHFFRSMFANRGVFSRTVMFVNQASDPIVERLLTPDLALKVAERFAVEQNKRVLCLMTDMTAYADALKEIGVAMERVPSNRGYTGDLYSQLALRYERACDYRGAGSVTIIAATTMPGGDVTHPRAGQHGLHHGGPVLPARRHDRSVRVVVAFEATGHRRGDTRGSLPGDEHHDPFRAFCKKAGR